MKSQTLGVLRMLALIGLMAAPMTFAQVEDPKANVPLNSAGEEPLLPGRTSSSGSVPRGSRVYIHPMNGFETYLAAGLAQKKVPVVVVNDRGSADFDITGVIQTDQEEGMKGWQAVAEIGLTGWRRGTKHFVNASLTFRSVQSGDVVFAYSVAKSGSNKVQQSAAEAFAKHLSKVVAKQ